MLFNIETTSGTWQYDNLSNTLYKDGVNPFEQFKLNYPKIPDSYQVNTDLYCLYINLGLRCNFHCPYCHQREIAPIFIEASPRLVPLFLQRLALSKLKPRRIKFWGGEPFVYFKTVEQLLPALHERYSSCFSITTNGSLLTKSKCDFLADYPITVVISYDGLNTQRDYPVLENADVVESIKYGLNKGLKFVVLPINAPFTDGADLVQKQVTRLFGQAVPVAWHGLIRCNNTNVQDVVRYDSGYIEKIQTMLNREFDKHDLASKLMQRIEHIRFTIIHGIPYGSRYNQYCYHASGDALTVDLAGNILTCMNAPNKIWGNLSDLSSVNITCFLKKEKCKACPYLCTCLGNCPLVTGEAADLNCNNVRPFYEVLFKRAVESLIGSHIISIHA